MDEAGRLYKQALTSELEALRTLRCPTPMSLAVMHRSAAWLALEREDIRLADKLASAGLAEDPPPKIADELREVLKQANLRRHLPT